MAITNILEAGDENEMATKSKVNKGSRIDAMIRRCDQENPKPEDMKALRAHLDQSDFLVRVNESSEHAFDRVIESYTKSAFGKELFKRQRNAKREALGFESANAMVKMLIDQVILCHIRLTTIESWHAGKMQESHTIQWRDHFDKTLSRYQRRFHKACESLAKVRKLLSEADLADQRKLKRCIN